MPNAATREPNRPPAKDQRPRIGPGRRGRPEGATPPLLIGGVKQHQTTLNRGEKCFEPMGAGVDYLTVTVPAESDAELVERTAFHAPGNARPGFQFSEERLLLGGTAWRRTNPIQPSKDYGDDYASWESSGRASDHLTRLALAVESRATRQDYAFDFACPADFYPRDILPVIRPHLDETRMVPRFVGPEHSCTVYLGSPNSDRRVKIYRRDLKDPGLLADGLPPQMRVELTLTGDLGKSLWHHRRTTGVDGLAIASTHVAEIIGHAPYNDLEPLPLLRYTSEEADAAQMLLQFCKQHASTILACDARGIDLVAIANAQRGVFSRTTEWRHQQRLEVFSRICGQAVTRRVIDTIRGTFRLRRASA